MSVMRLMRVQIQSHDVDCRLEKIPLLQLGPGRQPLPRPQQKYQASLAIVIDFQNMARLACAGSLLAIPASPCGG